MKKYEESQHLLDVQVGAFFALILGTGSVFGLTDHFKTENVGIIGGYYIWVSDSSLHILAFFE